MENLINMGKYTTEEFSEIINELFKQDDFKAVLGELLQKQTENILRIISSNHEIENEKIDKLTQEIKLNNKRFEDEIGELKHSLEYTQQQLETTLKQKDEQIKALDGKIDRVAITTSANKDTRELQRKLIDLEDRCRRSNLRIDGIEESDGERWSDCENKVKELFSQNLQVHGVEIERVHRVGEKKQDRHRTIVMKLLKYKDKERIMKNVKKLKGTEIYINEDFSAETLQKRKELWKKVKQFRDEGKYAVLNYDKIYVREGR